MKNVAYIFLLLILASCSSMKISYTKSADAVDFTKYKTFDFSELKASGDTITKNFTERTDILKNAIVAEMNERGYVRSTIHPDLLINIGIVVREQSQLIQPSSPVNILGLYREGAVSLDIVDAAENKIVWKGSITGIVPGKKSSAEKQTESGMKKLFERYPVEIKQ